MNATAVVGLLGSRTLSVSRGPAAGPPGFRGRAAGVPRPGRRGSAAGPPGFRDGGAMIRDASALTSRTTRHPTRRSTSAAAMLRRVVMRSVHFEPLAVQAVAGDRRFMTVSGKTRALVTG